MYQFPVGVIMDSLYMDTRSTIEKAAEIGAKGMQMYATKGENAPKNMTAAKRRELMDIMGQTNLCFRTYSAAKAVFFRYAVCCFPINICLVLIKLIIMLITLH